MKRVHRIPRWGWIAAGVLLLAMAAIISISRAGHVPALSYGAFLDQVDGGNVAAVTFHGTEIDVRLRRTIVEVSTAKPSADFTSRVPDFGDPSLIPLLRRDHVAIDIAAPSSWTWLLDRVPWPMLLFVAALLLAAVLRLVRGVQVAGPGLAAAGPMMGLMAALAAKQRGANETPGHRGDTQEPSAGK